MVAESSWRFAVVSSYYRSSRKMHCEIIRFFEKYHSFCRNTVNADKFVCLRKMTGGKHDIYIYIYIHMRLQCTIIVHAYCTYQIFIAECH